MLYEINNWIASISGCCGKGVSAVAAWLLLLMHGKESVKLTVANHERKFMFVIYLFPFKTTIRLS